ncbi:MAG: hypothetical protein ACE5HR_04780, partial [bacterium]
EPLPESSLFYPTMGKSQANNFLLAFNREFGILNQKGGVPGEVFLQLGEEVRFLEWKKIQKSWLGLFGVDKVKDF